MKDRFSKATEELSEKNAFVCEGCNVESGETIVSERLAEVETRKEGKHEGALHVHGLDVVDNRIEEIIYSDPTPFGA